MRCVKIVKEKIEKEMSMERIVKEKIEKEMSMEKIEKEKIEKEMSMEKIVKEKIKSCMEEMKGSSCRLGLLRSLVGERWRLGGTW